MRKKAHFRNLIYMLMLISALQSCSPVMELTDTKDLSYLYNPLKNPIHPRFRVYNSSDDESELSIKFFSNDLFFSEANPEGVPKSSMVILYRLFDMSQGMHPADTGIYNIAIREERGKREYLYKIPMDAPSGSQYEADVIIKDLIRDVKVQAHIPFDKTNNLNSFNFTARGHFNKLDLFNTVLKSNEFVNLVYKYSTDSIFIKYFEPDTAIPHPPSLLLPTKSLPLEASETVALPYSDTLPLMFPEKGIYMCSPDKNILEGYTFTNFGKEFPGMSKAETMIEPLAYLASADKLEKIRSADRPKAALDEFWLEITGNIERSRELIRIYYSRVLYANYFFTSHKEGWRTDRGMIYIIYGPPDKVYKSPDGERWGYHRQTVKTGWGIRYKVEDDYLYFNFSKRDNPFSEKDYILLRSENVTTYWDVAIRTWLSGIVFRLDNPSDI